jgi:hypothetical protein
MKARWVLPALLALGFGWWFTSGTRQVDAAAAPVWQMPTMPWDQPPPEFKEIQRSGFHAGVKAAVKDFDHHRDPDVMRHKRYVHPKVDKSLRQDYRQGYRRGYDQAFKHLEKSNGRHS